MSDGLAYQAALTRATALRIAAEGSHFRCQLARPSQGGHGAMGTDLIYQRDTWDQWMHLDVWMGTGVRHGLSGLDEG